MRRSSSGRRSKAKSRRPKYLSLRRHLTLPNSTTTPPPLPKPPEEPSVMSSSSSAVSAKEDERMHHHHQLDLFPLHPEHLDRDPQVACLLADDAGCGGAAGGEIPTLAALLGSDGAAVSSGSLSEASPVSSSMNWDGDGDGLARRALRGRERWVYCRSSASSPEEEVASSVGFGGGGVDLKWCAAPQALSLKLDYDEILTAWSDRGSLYIDGEGPQVVPQLQHADPYDSAAAFPVLVEVGCSAWRVPEKAPEADNDRTTMLEVKEKEFGSREARVLRYKEKRMSRLFAKRIRYEVRKLNAEKRPRWKGRFIKRKDDIKGLLHTKDER